LRVLKTTAAKFWMNESRNSKKRQEVVAMANGVCLSYERNLLPLSVFHSTSSSYIHLSEAQLKCVKEFNRRLGNGEIEFEAVHCLCGGGLFDLIASVDRYSMIQYTVICTQCGIVQSNPRMRENAYREFYSSELYRRIYDPDGTESYYRASAGSRK